MVKAMSTRTMPMVMTEIITMAMPMMVMPIIASGFINMAKGLLFPLFWLVPGEVLIVSSMTQV